MASSRISRRHLIWLGVAVGVVSLAAISVFLWKKEAEHALTTSRPDIISHYTQGDISRAASIQVHFTQNVVEPEVVGTPLKESPFRFSPEIKGLAIWRTPSILEFRPAEWLPSSQAYKASLDYSELAEQAQGEEEFQFHFSVRPQSFDVTVEGLQAATAESMVDQILTGMLVTADVALPADVEKTITAEYLGKSLSIQWVHEPEQQRHRFSLSGIARQKKKTAVTLAWNGVTFGVDKKGSLEVPVPSLDQFEVVQARAVQEEQKFVEIRMSDPLDRRQNLQGLISLNQGGALRFSIERSILRVYAQTTLNGEVLVQVRPGVRNVLGYKLKTLFETRLQFEEMKPQVRFPGQGVIVPTTKGLTVPIESVNVKNLRVRAFSIFGENMPQFLQVNTLDTAEELGRVGRVVWEKSIPLHFSADKKDRWIRSGLDLTPLLEKYPGGMIRLELSFGPEDVVFDCADMPKSGKAKQRTSEQVEEQEESNWDGVEEGEEGYDEDGGGNYSQRLNPCNAAYYRSYYDHTITAAKNILISDIGLLAKQGEDKTVLVVATDLKTAKPLSGTKLTLLDFQHQVITKGSTDGDGMAKLAADRQPFVLLASNNKQSGYLKLDRGSALSVSHFDVSGIKVENGLKGFIFGERGVWRPGDPIHLTFILLDMTGNLPANHPAHLELVNPRGQVLQRQTNTRPMNGFYIFEAKTSSEAPTGKWTARISVGGAVFEKVLPIETVMPNRLKIGLDFNGKTRLSQGAVTGQISASWLHGAPGKNLKAEVSALFSAVKTTFAGYDGFFFDDPLRRFESEKLTVFEGTLGGEGKAAIESSMKLNGAAPGRLQATFTTRIFEPGGAFSIDTFTLPFDPFERYVGLRTSKGDVARGMLTTDIDHPVEIAVVDRDGKPVSEGTVEIKVYKLQWRWWWEAGEERLADYAGTESLRPIKQEKVTVKNGKAQWMLRINQPEWGRYLVHVTDTEGKHSAGRVVYIDWPGWAGRGQKGFPGGATVLNFAADKTEYAVGDDVVVTIPMAAAGRGLVSLESGSRVLKTQWIEGPAGSLRYTFKATEDMAPNIYVHVTTLQPHLQTVNDLPMRMYGVLPIKVSDPKTKLAPRIESPNEFAPESRAKITVSEANGKAMTYTLALVDEGLLSLTRFATPDPWTHFYQREALGVRTWDLYDLVAGAYGGTLEQLLAIGGDESAKDAGRKKKADRFPPVVRFLGPFSLKKGGMATHSVDIPQYVGSVRVMVVAGHDRAFGSTEKQVFVRKPLMILSTLPRVVGPEELVELPVSVFAMSEKVKKVTVSIFTQGGLAIDGPSERQMTFAAPGDELAIFKLKVGSKTGVARVTAKATGHGEVATQTIEIDIRHPGGRVVDVFRQSLKPGETMDKDLSLPGMPGTNSAMLELWRIPPLNLDKRLDFLMTYPHGCVEQTTSAAFPQLYLGSLMELSAGQQAEIQHNIKGGIDRLRLFQASDGGFAYWPGEGSSDDWSSSYAGHFLVEAQRAGYPVPDGILDQWKGYQRKKAQAWSPGASRSDLIQAYRLYTLALVGTPELGAMNRLKEQKALLPEVLWRLAAAYQLAGQPEAAQEMTSKATMSVAKYVELGNTYGSDLRDQAMILEAMCLLKDWDKAAEVAKDVAAKLDNDAWWSTQTTAFSLMAMAKYAGVGLKEGQDMKASFAWNNGRKDTLATRKPLVQQRLEIKDQTKGSLSVSNQGQGMLHVRVILKGVPPLGKETSAQNGLDLNVKYLNPDDGVLDPSSLEQGTDFTAEVTVKNTGLRGTYQELALSHIVPSGWEIVNMRLNGPSQSRQSGIEYQDVRDDRVLTYFDLKQGELKTFKVSLTASYVGRYYLPAISAEAMYDAAINGRVQGQWVTVTSPGGRAR